MIKINIYTIFLTLALPCLALPCLASILYLNKLNLIISISKNITLIYGVFNKFSINSYKNNIFINIQNFIFKEKNYFMEDDKDIIYYYGGFAVILILGIIFIVFYSEEIAWYYSLPMIILSISFLFLPTVLTPESKFRCIIPIFTFIFQLLSIVLIIFVFLYALFASSSPKKKRKK